MNTAVELKNVTKTFGDTIANNSVSMSIEQGEILAVLGENGSGKTTLMNMISGIYFPDSGHIFVDGQEVTIRSPRDAFDIGIGMIHQHYKLVEVLTAAENIVLGLPRERKVSNADITAKIREIGEHYGFDINPDKKVYEMSISEKQTVEIVKALYRGASILILDEPTAVLTPQETDRLFDVLRNMRDDGKAVVIITHKLNEVMAISGKVAVLRRGEYIGTVDTASTTPQELAEMMVGKAISFNIERSEPADKVERLTLQGVTCVNSEDMPTLEDVSFTAYGGEILGVAGVAGSGQRELCEAIAGLYPVSAGEILYCAPSVKAVAEDNSEILNSIPITHKTPTEIRQLGIKLAFVPEDRLGMGLVGGMHIVDNMMLKEYRRGRSFFADRRTPKQLADSIVHRLEVMTPNVFTPVRRLSGGNVQKVLLGREISSQPTVLIAAYPVRGLDINSSYTVYNLLNEQKKLGTAVIYIGEDLDVLLELCDRVLVLCGGKVSGIVNARTATKEEVGLLMTGA